MDDGWMDDRDKRDPCSGGLLISEGKATLLQTQTHIIQYRTRAKLRRRDVSF
jgi:hypothetical protein